MGRRKSGEGSRGKLQKRGFLKVEGVWGGACFVLCAPGQRTPLLGAIWLKSCEPREVAAQFWALVISRRLSSSLVSWPWPRTSLWKASSFAEKLKRRRLAALLPSSLLQLSSALETQAGSKTAAPDDAKLSSPRLTTCRLLQAWKNLNPLRAESQ